MSLKSQRRMAAEILKVGENRVWIDPERTDEVESAIAREEIRRLIRQKAIRKLPEKGVSRARARVLHEKKKKGKRRGPGSRYGSEGARTPSKEAWMMKIRAQRKRLRELKDSHAIPESVYRRLYVMAKSGSFRSVSDLNRYIEAHNLRRRR
ncbi:MAG: 50S ribosomal protein L19e [Candidatus Bathyarchaeota archaeon]|nr:50S ribosomal protein L19e [Candidatus Bathyarchaeota archaeon]